MKKHTPAPHYFTDDDGRRLVALHVHGSDDRAVTEAALWDNAKRRHKLTGSLFLNHDGQGRSYVYAREPGTNKQSPLARLLLNLRRAYRVRYADRNPLNLLPENFRLVARWADEGTAAEALALQLDSARQDTSATEGEQA